MGKSFLNFLTSSSSPLLQRNSCSGVSDGAKASSKLRYVLLILVLIPAVHVLFATELAPTSRSFSTNTKAGTNDENVIRNHDSLSVLPRSRWLRQKQSSSISDDLDEPAASLESNNAPETYALHAVHSIRDANDSVVATDCNSELCQSMRSLEEEAVETSLPFPYYVSLIFVIILVLLSALFSGLTLGLMGLDKTGLEIVMDGDDPISAKQAQVIYPVRSNGNLLLCTLLLGNVAVNALLSILMAEVAGGLAGFLVSTALLVVFGEILPQAICSRYALAIGSRTVWLVKIIIALLLPLAYPLAWCLNKALGRELGTIYTKAEMRKLVEIHAERGGFNKDMTKTMTGALVYQDVKVSEVMTTLSKTYMLSVDEKLNYPTIVRIFKTGYSRIPIYEANNKNNVIGLLFVKDLIFVDPEDETPIRNFVQMFGRGLHVVWPDDTLGDVLKELKSGRSHMALVRDVNNDDADQDPFYEVKGIITLEDIIEVIIGAEIVDETDAFMDHGQMTKVSRRDFDFDKLRLLDTKIVDKIMTKQEQMAVTSYLRMNYGSVMKLLTDRQLTKMVAETRVTELQPMRDEDYPENIGESNELKEEEILYEKGVPNDLCTLILSGKVSVIAGQDEFQSDAGPWSVLAAQALTDSMYNPDFTARVSSEPCRCLRFTRDRFNDAVDASAAERIRKTGTGSPGAASQVSSKTKETQDEPTEESTMDTSFNKEGLNETNTSLDQTLSIVNTNGDCDPLEQRKQQQQNNANVQDRKFRRSMLLAAFKKQTSEFDDCDDHCKVRSEEHVNGDIVETDPCASMSQSHIHSLEEPGEEPDETIMSPLQMQLTNGGSLIPRPKYMKSKTDATKEKKEETHEPSTDAGVEYIDFGQQTQDEEFM
mmetsp:Transcript_54432/g.80800  ORF Transcript_54432/g.80800 Transcript_54432/m.80800 type:complete len:879 (+) Transcript_54432:45-2681(+)